MLVRTLAVYDGFQCVASECVDNCCHGNKLVIDNKTYFEYQRLIAKGDPFGLRLLSSIRERNGEPSFRMKENGDCPFLMKNRLCELQLRLGKDKVCETCREYPTFYKDYGNRREVGLRFSCPEVLRIALTHPQAVEFREKEVDTIPVKTEGLDSVFLENLYPFRDRVLALVQERKLSVSRLLAILLRLGDEAQKLIDRKKYAELPSLIAPYSKSDFIMEQPGGVFNPKKNEKVFSSVLNIHYKLEPEKDIFTEKTGETIKAFFGKKGKAGRIDEQKKFLSRMKERDYEYGKWLFYFLHRYLLDAVYDGNLLDRIKLAVVSTVFLIEVGAYANLEKGSFSVGMQEAIFRGYSRNVEEYEKNLSILLKKMNSSVFSVGNLLSAVAIGEDIPDAVEEEKE